MPGPSLGATAYEGRGRGGRAVTQVGNSGSATVKADAPHATPNTSSILYMQHVGGKGGFESPAALERRVHGRARLRVAVERVLDDGVVGTIRN